MLVLKCSHARRRPLRPVQAGFVAEKALRRVYELRGQSCLSLLLDHDDEFVTVVLLM